MTEEPRPLPQSERAEKGLLSSMLQSPARVIDELMLQNVSSAYLHHPARRRMFETIVAMRESGRSIDLISVTQRLENDGHLAEVGGATEVTEIYAYTPTAANYGEYLGTLRDMSIRRQLLTAAWDQAACAYDFDREAEIIAADAEARLMRIGEGASLPSETTQCEAAQDALNELERIARREGKITGLSTGFTGIDEMTDGLHGGEMFVIAARPSMGKTALAMNIAEHVAFQEGHAVGVYSLEMSRRQLLTRLISSRAHVDLKRMRQGFVNESDLDRLSKSGHAFASSRLYIDDSAGISIQQLRAHARRWHTRHDIRLLVVDYIQLLKSPSRRGQENRQIEIAEISSGLKNLAKELDIPIIAIAQLNRAPDSRGGKATGRPRMSDLRESGAIEQDADVVALLWREEYYTEDANRRKAVEGQADLIIAKQRNGAIGDIPLQFLREQTRFVDRPISAI